MRTTSILAFCLCTLFIFTSCKKEKSKEITESTNLSAASNELKQHQSKITDWIKYIPLNGSFKGDVKISSKTITVKGQFITSIQIGEKGNSFLFISDNKKFHAFGINASKLNNQHTGAVEIYDFQDLTRKLITYNEGKNIKQQYYASDNLLNAYKGLYPVKNVSATGTGFRTTDDPTLLKAIRKFFCQLFGGFWRNSIAENSTSPNGDCAFGDNNNDVPQDFIDDGTGGTTYWGVIYPNLNDASFFDLSSSMWSNLQAGMNSGSSANNWNLSTPTSTIDASCHDPERIKTLFYVLNTKSNQQLSYVDYGSFEATLTEYQTYKNQLQVPLPIAPLLLKGGPNGSVDALLQAQYIYQTKSNAPSLGAAFGNDNFNRIQATLSITNGLAGWNIPPLAIGTSAFMALENILVKEIDGAYGTNNYDLLGYDFIAKFYPQLGVGNIDASNPKNTLNAINSTLFSNIQQLKLTERHAYYLLGHTANNTLLSQYLLANPSDEVLRLLGKESVNDAVQGKPFTLPSIWVDHTSTNNVNRIIVNLLENKCLEQVFSTITKESYTNTLSEMIRAFDVNENVTIVMREDNTLGADTYGECKGVLDEKIM